MAFGSNLGKRIKNLKAGIVLCQEELLFLATSHWKVTKPLSHRDYDIRNHGSYVNFVADVSSALSPTDLHSLTFSVEKKSDIQTRENGSLGILTLTSFSSQKIGTGISLNVLQSE